MKYFWLFLLLPSILMARVHPFLGIGVGRQNGNEAIPAGFVGGANMGLEAHSLGAEFSFNHIDQITKFPDLSRQGSLTIMPLMFNLYASPGIGRGWHITGKAGISYVLCERTLTTMQSMAEAYPNYKITDQIKSGIGYQFGGGVAYQANKHLRISLEVIQMFFETTLTHTRVNWNSYQDITYTETQDLDLGTVLGLLGLRYYF